MTADSHGRLPASFTTPGTSSFLDFLAQHDPSLLPVGRNLPGGEMPGTTHGTTIVALAFDGGIVMAGDRRAAHREGVPGGRVLRGGYRRHRRAGAGAGAAVPAGAGALREDRGHPAVACLLYTSPSPRDRQK